jgi:DNA adenine methylase
MKTPLSYYGGKQQLASRILELIPEHRIYCEPFLGGAAIFFAKEPSSVEVINDTNGELINFYEVVQQDLPALKKEIQISLHSRRQHRHAEVIYSNPEMFDRIKRAWAVWMLANGSYGNNLTGGYAYGRYCTSHSKTMANKRARFFIDDYAARLHQVQIEFYDALRIITSRDTENTFFYLDPPYVGSDQGHYDGYTQNDFDALLAVLGKLKGKFLLSSYRNKSLAEFAERNKWHTLEFKMGSSMTHSSKAPRTKIEVLTANYPIPAKDGPKSPKR